MRTRREPAGFLAGIQHASGYARGFTLIELLIVLFIMALLAAIASPMLSQLVKTSRVQQAAHALTPVLFQARSEAQRYRRMVAVFMGDDETRLDPKPDPGVLPGQGSAEIWTVRTWSATAPPDREFDDGTNPSSGLLPAWVPYVSTWAQPPSWYPYKGLIRNLTPNPITFPDGVRMLAGNFSRTWNAAEGRYDHSFGFGSYNKSATGEIKRHQIAYSRSGGMPFYYDGLHTYWNVLVFDEVTGEHLLIWCGNYLGSARPRVLPYTITQLGNPSQNWRTISDFRQIPAWIDQ